MPETTWPVPLPGLTLQDGTAHVWRTSLDIETQLQNHFMRCLSDEELQRANRFKFEIDRVHFIASHGILRSILAHYLGCRPAEIRYESGPYGKPSLVGDTALHFNISHAGNLAVLGFADRSIGVDLEHIQPRIDIEEIATRFFAPAEVQSLMQLPPDQRLRGFYTCWTRKEAFIKALGDGLSCPLDQFEVSLSPGEPPGLLTTRWDPEESKRWSLHALEPGDGYVGALAAAREIHTVKCWQWTIQSPILE